MLVMQVIVLHPCNKFEVSISPFGRYRTISDSALIGIMTLTFDLSTSKWSHGSPTYPCHAKFQLLMPFHCRLRVRHGTDRRTERRQSSTLNAPTYGGGEAGHDNNYHHRHYCQQPLQVITCHCH